MEEAADILLTAQNEVKDLSMAPTKPQSGDIFLYIGSPDTGNQEMWRKDGLPWKHGGRHSVKSNGHVIRKTYHTFKDSKGVRKRSSYEIVSDNGNFYNTVLIHYTGDDNAYEASRSTVGPKVTLAICYIFQCFIVFFDRFISVFPVISFCLLQPATSCIGGCRHLHAGGCTLQQHACSMHAGFIQPALRFKCSHFH